MLNQFATPTVTPLPYEILSNKRTGDFGLSMNANVLRGTPVRLSVHDVESCNALFVDKNNQALGSIMNLSRDVIRYAITKGFLRFYEMAKSGVYICHVLQFSCPSFDQLSNCEAVNG